MGVKNWSKVIPWHWADIAELTPEAIAFDLPNYLARRTSVVRTLSPDRISLIHIHVTFSTIRACLRLQILPVFVFDGPPEHLKRLPNPELVSRASLLYKEFSQSHDPENIRIVEELNQNIALRSYFAGNHVRDLCSCCGVPILASPSEAELAAAILCKDGKVGTVVSNDADALLFGSPHVTRSLRLSKGQIERARLEDLKESLSLNLDQLRDLAIICGCDFHQGLKGLGPRKGAIQLKRHGDLLSVLKAQGLTPYERRDVMEAREVFDEGEYLDINETGFTLKPPMTAGFLKLMEPVVGEARAELMMAELVRLWKDFGKVQTTLEQWI